MSDHFAAIEWPPGWLDGPLVGFENLASADGMAMASGCTDQGTSLFVLGGVGFTMFGRFTCAPDGTAGPWQEQFVGDVPPLAHRGWEWLCGAAEEARTASLGDLLADALLSPAEYEGEDETR